MYLYVCVRARSYILNGPDFRTDTTCGRHYLNFSYGRETGIIALKKKKSHRRPAISVLDSAIMDIKVQLVKKADSEHAIVPA